MAKRDSCTGNVCIDAQVVAAEKAVIAAKIMAVIELMECGRIQRARNALKQIQLGLPIPSKSSVDMAKKIF